MRRRLLKSAGVLFLSASMIFSGSTWSAKTQAAGEGTSEAKTGEILIDGNDIKKDNINGLTFKGFGLLSGNSTSDLLMDYKAENPQAYAKLMQYL